MSQLITRRRSVTNAPPALLASTAPVVSAPLIGEPTPLAKATSTTSQVPVPSTSSVSEEQMRAHLMAQGEEMRTYAEMVKDLVQLYRCPASKSCYQHLILLHLRPHCHLALPIPSSPMY
ncbi:hypothetical protein ACFX15_039245 [Malus domestica]